MAATPAQVKVAELLGTDIAINAEGNFSVTFRNGYYDLATISGENNLRQALLNRLRAVAKLLNSRKPGDLLAHPDYGVGILGLVSNPYPEAIQKAQTQIISNFAAEPRIKPIEPTDIVFTWDSIRSLLEIQVTYTLITSEIPQNLVFPIYIS